MSVLWRKLLRTARSTRGQFLALAAVVMTGVAVYISMATAFYNLNLSKDKFYRENNFADYYFHVVKAPQQVTGQIERVPGVMRATGRIQKDVPVFKEGSKRAIARIVGYPVPMDNEVNRLHLLTGRLFEENPQGGRIEILLDPQYAEANGLSAGDTVTVAAEGRLVDLTVTGTATSPEFVYPMKDAASLMPEPETFGIVMMPLRQAQQIFNLSGQVNQVAVQLAPGVDEKRVAEQVKAILEPYGNLADYPRRRQLSDAVLQGELDGLKSQSKVMPAIFLGIAAAIQFIMLGRMIRAQRLQIGVMKAMGYNNRQVMSYYTGYALMVAFCGALAGTLLGVLLASVISGMYAQFFNLPESISGINLKAIFYGFVISLGVGAAAGLAASRGVTAVNPAESMRPEPPKSAGKIFLEGWNWLWRRLDPAWKASMRAVARNRGRSAVTMLGVVFAVGMMVMAFFARDSVDYLLKGHFYEEHHYDYLVRFTVPVKENELLNITRIDGVLKAEPVFEIPARMRFSGRSEEGLLFGLPPDVTLKELVGDKGQPLRLPEEGIFINRRTADKLGVKTGDLVEVETLLGLGPNRRAVLKVAGVNSQLIGSSSYISLKEANRVLGESCLVSGVMLKVDPGRAGAIEEELDEMTGVSSILSRQKELANFNKYLDSLIYSISVIIIFAVVLGFAIVYNSSVISFAERRRELASLRVIGFTAGEVSGLLLKENLIQSLPGVALGLPFGKYVAQAYIKAMSTDIFTLPVVIYSLTYVLSALGGIIFIAAAHVLAVRGVRRLDLVDVLKERD